MPSISTPSAYAAWGTTGSSMIDEINRQSGRGFARYAKTDSQSFSDEVPTKITFNSAIVTHADVSYTTGTGTDFTLNRAGIWMFTAVILLSDPGATDIYRTIGFMTSDDSLHFGEGEETYNNFATNLVAATVRRFSAAATVSVYAYQSSGGSQTTYTPLTGANAERSNFTLTWLGD